MNSEQEPAIYADPQVTMELYQAIKSFKVDPELRQDWTSLMLSSGLTDRDLILFLLGKMAGIHKERERFLSFLERKQVQA